MLLQRTLASISRGSAGGVGEPGVKSELGERRRGSDSRPSGAEGAEGRGSSSASEDREAEIKRSPAAADGEEPRRHWRAGAAATGSPALNSDAP